MTQEIEKMPMCVGADVRRGCPYDAAAMPPVDRLGPNGNTLRFVRRHCAACLEWKNYLEPRIQALEGQIAELRADRARSAYLVPRRRRGLIPRLLRRLTNWWRRFNRTVTP